MAGTTAVGDKGPRYAVQMVYDRAHSSENPNVPLGQRARGNRQAKKWRDVAGWGGITMDIYMCRPSLAAGVVVVLLISTLPIVAPLLPSPTTLSLQYGIQNIDRLNIGRPELLQVPELIVEEGFSEKIERKGRRQ